MARFTADYSDHSSSDGDSFETKSDAQADQHFTLPPRKPSTDIAKAGADAQWEGLVEQHRAAFQALKEVENKMWEYRYRNIWPSTEEQPQPKQSGVKNAAKSMPLAVDMGHHSHGEMPRCWADWRSCDYSPASHNSRDEDGDDEVLSEHPSNLDKKKKHKIGRRIWGVFSLKNRRQ